MCDDYNTNIDYMYRNCSVKNLRPVESSLSQLGCYFIGLNLSGSLKVVRRDHLSRGIFKRHARTNYSLPISGKRIQCWYCACFFELCNDEDYHFELCNLEKNYTERITNEPILPESWPYWNLVTWAAAVCTGYVACGLSSTSMLGLLYKKMGWFPFKDTEEEIPRSSNRSTSSSTSSRST